MSSTSTSIQDFPPELLSDIFACLAQPAPSERALHEQPEAKILKIDPTTNGSYLKAVSRICKQWRAIVLPILFRNIIWRPQIHSFDGLILRPHFILEFLGNQNLAHHVQTFTLMVDFAAEEVEESELHRQIWPDDLCLLWTRLFSVIDPLRFTIMAPPCTLAAFMNRMLFLSDAWSFDTPYHILSLARSDRQVNERTMEALSSHSSEPSSTPGSSREHTGSIRNHDDDLERTHLDLRTSLARGTISLPRDQTSMPPTSTLFTIRPWTSVLLNEGSSIRAYHTYEYFLRQPPSMLSALLGTGEYPNNVALLPPTITDFNYIAVFPLASHVQSLFADLPKIERLFIQLTPRPSNQVLQDKNAMRNIDMADLWMERNTAYSHLFAELTQVDPRGHWGSLKVFESGDAADQESWNMAVDFLKQNEITNWVPERDGSLIRVEDDNHRAPARRVVHHLLGDETLGVPLLSVPPLAPRIYPLRVWFGPDNPIANYSLPKLFLKSSCLTSSQARDH